MIKHHTRERPQDEGQLASPAALDPDELEEQEDARSLDLVQRLVASALAIVVGGSISLVLAVYTASEPADVDAASRIGLWVMAGVTGLLTTIVVLVINRRHAYSPFLLLGLLPMACSAYWVLT